MPWNDRTARRAHALAIALFAGLAVLLAACSSADGGGGGGTAPTVTATDPADGATGVALGSDITVTFSEAMNRPDAQAAFSASPAVTCSFTWNASDTEMTCDPDADLNAGASYTVTIAASATSATGEALGGAHEVTFDVATPSALPTCEFGTHAFGACAFGP